MPLYDYKCSVCGHGKEVMLRLAELDRHVEKCGHCGLPMNRQVSAPMVLGDYEPYQCPVTGAMIEGRKAHRENLARTGCRILEPGESEGYKRACKADDEKLDAAVEETVDAAIAQMPTDKRDKLAAEMEHGIDAQIVRTSL